MILVYQFSTWAEERLFKQRSLDPTTPYRSLKVFGWACLSLLILAVAVAVSMAVSSATQIKLDDIKIFYHGLALDDARRPIDITRDDLPRLYLELARAALEATPPESAVSQAVRTTQALNGVAPAEISNAPDAAASLIAKLDFVTDILVEENNENPRFPRKYKRYLDIVRSLANPMDFKETPQLESALRPYVDSYKERREEEYESCSDPSVPEPPDYGSPLWNEHLELNPRDGLLQQLKGKDRFYYPSQILFYNQKELEPRGLCSLLKRYKVTNNSAKIKELQIVAVICESYETGRSCFWEKPLIDENGMKIAEEDLKNPVHSGISSTWPNSVRGITHDPCTACHIGNNSFIFYQGSDLCYNEKFHPGQLVAGDLSCYGKRDQWSKPVGSLLLPGAKMDVGDGQNKCMTCHTLAVSAYDDWYCRLLNFATGNLMPPNGSKNGLSWEGPSPHNKYEESVAQIRAQCRK